jgi:hypothetical protein
MPKAVAVRWPDRGPAARSEAAAGRAGPSGPVAIRRHGGLLRRSWSAGRQCPIARGLILARRDDDGVFAGLRRAIGPAIRTAGLRLPPSDTHTTLTPGVGGSFTLHRLRRGRQHALTRKQPQARITKTVLPQVRDPARRRGRWRCGRLRDHRASPPRPGAAWPIAAMRCRRSHSPWTVPPIGFSKWPGNRAGRFADVAHGSPPWLDRQGMPRALPGSSTS